MLRFAALDFFWDYHKYYNQYKFNKNSGLPSSANFKNLCNSSNTTNEIKLKNDKIIKMQLDNLQLDFSKEKNKFNKDYSKFYSFEKINKQTFEKNTEQNNSQHQNEFNLFTKAIIITFSSFGAIYIFRKIIFKQNN